jgi:hypothetical protein
MVNGFDKNWVRLRLLIRGFKKKYGKIPNVIYLHPLCLDNLRNDLFTPESLARIEKQVKLVPIESRFDAEDDTGNILDYNTALDLPPFDDESEADWLKMEVDRPDAWILIKSLVLTINTWAPTFPTLVSITLQQNQRY